MALDSIVILTTTIAIVNANVINNVVNTSNSDVSEGSVEVDNSADAFRGVYSECLLYLSYYCLQKKTLLYLKALNNLTEVSVIGDYVKFVKINTTEAEQRTIDNPEITSHSEALSLDIDNAVNNFFDSHILRFKALGKDIAMSHSVDEFVGRKKRKGGGGGGGGGGHDDGKKKMMMMAMMCMKMKMMMMIPAMMGMMGMMSFKGMMFSMMTFMMSKMMLLMKILEKKGGGGGSGGGGGGGDGWAAGGGGGGAWMPAGGQDYGGGGGGGYDANGQWQSRSIIENEKQTNEPIISYVTPLVRYNNNANGRKPYLTIKNLNDEVIKANAQSRKRRNIIDVLNSQKLKINEAKVAHASPRRTTHSLKYYLNNEVAKGNLNSRKRRGLDDYLLNRENIEPAELKPTPNDKYIIYANKDNANLNSNVKKDKTLKRNIAKKSEFDDSSQLQSFTENGHERDYPIMSFIAPSIKYNSNGKAYSIIKNLSNEFINTKTNIKSRQKRGIIDVLQNTYLYWMNQVLGSRYNNKVNYPKYRIVNGVKYVYYPLRYIQMAKKPKALNEVKEEVKTVITAEDFNKGEIVEGPVESRMHKKKLIKMKDNVSETVDDNPWE